MRQELQNKIIIKYGEIFSDYWDKSTPINPMVFGIECDDGWFDIINTSMHEIAKYAQSHFPLGFTIRQVKEKFGSLDIYTSHSDEVIHNICMDAKIESYKTCEVCGTKENVGMTKGWFKTICKDCYEISHLKKIGKKWDTESIYKNFEK